MGKFKNFNSLRSLLLEGEKYGLDLLELISKLDGYTSSLEKGTVKIVLLGSFSDGKTSVISGLLGKLESNMKIDEDESSDELSIYHLEGFGRQYDIVDTPGLFGTKEKVIDGMSVKFSELTEKYISEAHVVIYICNSVNTLKDSHQGIIKKVLRDYEKLESAIFVINKMDEVADTNDDDEYAYMSNIKRNTFIERLKQVISLTSEEEEQLKVVCVAANPKGKGLEKWFEKKEEYLKRSRIPELKHCMKSVIFNNDLETFFQNSDSAVVQDLVKGVSDAISNKAEYLDASSHDLKKSLDKLHIEMDVLDSSIKSNKEQMNKELIDLRKNTLSEVDSIASLSELRVFLETEIGTEGKEVDFNVLERSVNQILSTCAEANSAQIKANAMTFEREFSVQANILSDLAKKGLGQLALKVNNKMVLNIRNIFFKGHKFKPWGAVKVARNIKGAALVLTAVIDAVIVVKKLIDNKKLNKYKMGLSDIIIALFKNIFKLFDNDVEYYKNFAPSFLELEENLKDREKALQEIETKIDELKNYRNKIIAWYGNDIKDIEFEEVI